MAGKGPRFGISVYCDFCADEEEIDRRLQQARELGYTEVFTSLELATLKFANTEAGITPKVRHLLDRARRLQLTVHADANAEVFAQMGAAPDNLEPFHALGIPVLRIDGGFSGRQIAVMTGNPFGMKIEDNLSDYSQLKAHLTEVQKSGSLSRFCACHNFFPHNDTGLDYDQAVRIARTVRESGCETGIFIGSESSSHELYEHGHGVTTIESLRWLPARIQAALLRAEDCFSSIIFGDVSPAAAELQAAAEQHTAADVMPAEQRAVMSAQMFAAVRDLPVLDVPVYWENLDPEVIRFLEQQVYFNRSDTPAKMIRITSTREKIRQDPALTVRRETGIIMLNNRECGHYAGEIHIICEEMPAVETANCIGRVKSYGEPLLKLIRTKELPFRLICY